MAGAGAEAGGGAGGWSWEDNKAFEIALATVPAPPEEEGAEGEERGGRWWDLIAARVPGKTAAEVRQHYELLVEDVEAIEAGRVPLPRYGGEESPPSLTSPSSSKENQKHRHQQQQDPNSHLGSSDRKKMSLCLLISRVQLESVKKGSRENAS